MSPDSSFIHLPIEILRDESELITIPIDQQSLTGSIEFGLSQANLPDGYTPDVHLMAVNLHKFVNAIQQKIEENPGKDFPQIYLYHGSAVLLPLWWQRDAITSERFIFINIKILDSNIYKMKEIKPGLYEFYEDRLQLIDSVIAFVGTVDDYIISLAREEADHHIYDYDIPAVGDNANSTYYDQDCFEIHAVEDLLVYLKSIQNTPIETITFLQNKLTKLKNAEF